MGSFQAPESDLETSALGFDRVEDLKVGINSANAPEAANEAGE